MKYIYILFIIIMVTGTVRAGEDPQVEIYITIPSGWQWHHDIGEWEGPDYTHFIPVDIFVGEPIYMQLRVESRKSNMGISWHSLESLLKCIRVGLYDVIDGRRNAYADMINGKVRPKYTIDISGIRYDSKDPNYHKNGLLQHGDESESIHTEWIDITERDNNTISPGTYQVAIIVGGKACIYNKTILYGSASIIRIHEVTASVKIKSMKMCWDGIKKIMPPFTGRTLEEWSVEYNRNATNRTLVEKLANEYFLPALNIYPDLKCGLKQMANICKVINDKECFRRYYERYCSTPMDARWERTCRDSMSAQLENWDPTRL